ncbi:MAG: flippase-like domain-containing protein [Bacteroidetes bacterium]|nr:flippase-like domain-containing protein [Bacteroidota bacterium]
MKQYILPALKFLVFLGLGILLIWLVVKNLSEKDKTEIFKSLSEANYLWIILAMGLGIIAHLSRAIRWKMLLAPLGFKPKTTNTFYAVMVGYLGNLALPRLGEVLRCGILKRYEKIPLTQSFGTVIAERVIDLFTLLVLFIISAWIEYARMHEYISENIITPIKNKLHGLTENKLLLIALIGIILGGVFLFYFFRKKILQNPIAQKIKALLLGFLDGIRTIANVKSPLLFLFHSLFIWVMYLMTVYVCVFAFKETESLSFTDCLAIMCFGSLGVIATPGGIGAYQWIVLQIMLLWGFTTAMGVAFGWVVWLAQTVVVLLGGLLSFGLLAINNKEK